MQLDQKRLGFLILIFSCCHIYAQVKVVSTNEEKFKNLQPSIGKVFYNFTYLRDTTQPNNLYKEEFELDFSKTTSLFSNYSMILQDSIMQTDIMNQLKNASDPNHVDLILHRSASISTDKFFIRLQPDTSVYDIRAISSQLFAIKDTQARINWKILDSTKSIEGNICQKAIGESHGRIYTAWFCSDIPYNFGPRRLNGLPGLIVEAYDDKHEVAYTLNHLQANIVTRQIGLSENAIPATAKEYQKAYDAYIKNPQAFVQAYSASTTLALAPKTNNPFGNIDPSKIKSITVIKDDHSINLIKENNPIDLR
ncbi:MAG TPA: GLPGLI family protein [Arachidicoccus sp.]